MEENLVFIGLGFVVSGVLGFVNRSAGWGGIAGVGAGLVYLALTKGT